MFYSQQNEDRYLFEKYLNYKNGFFIELGAMNGVQYSNTLFFENQLNWTGILIEPTIQFFDLEKNRPNCHNFNFAVSEFEGEVEFVGDDAVSGMLRTMPDWHRVGWGLDKKKIYKVKSKPLFRIIESLKIDVVDFFSIDVEGGEVEVLKTFDWTIPVYLILIEGNYTIDKDPILRKNNFPKIDGDEWKRKDECTEILKNNGFEYVEDIGCNQIWINKNNKRK